jgi:hypothetical protein
MALPVEAEKEPIEEILYFEVFMVGLTLKGVRKLACNFLKANPHLKDPFGTKAELPGKEWQQPFMKRLYEPNLLQPQSVPIAHSKDFNKRNVSHVVLKL